VLVVLGVGLAFLAVAAAAEIAGRRARRPTDSSTLTTDERAVDRYEIRKPNINSPYLRNGKLAPPIRWQGPGPWFLIWDRERNKWVDGVFTTRAAAERRLDELTNSVGVTSRPRRFRELRRPD
jgi:hypothetical protein